jgi:hypothetical protein
MRTILTTKMMKKKEMEATRKMTMMATSLMHVQTGILSIPDWLCHSKQTMFNKVDELIFT